MAKQDVKLSSQHRQHKETAPRPLIRRRDDKKREMKRVKSAAQVQRFLFIHSLRNRLRVDPLERFRVAWAHQF
jgi:hypothetical protein